MTSPQFCDLIECGQMGAAGFIFLAAVVLLASIRGA
jgi:hypothetical protein